MNNKHLIIAATLIAVSILVLAYSLNRVALEIAGARKESSELVQRQWFRLQVEPLRDGEADKYATQQQLLSALSEQNAHNAFYYVQGLLNTEPEATIQLLLTLGALYIRIGSILSYAY